MTVRISTDTGGGMALMSFPIVHVTNKTINLIVLSIILILDKQLRHDSCHSWPALLLGEGNYDFLYDNKIGH